ncbi:hypothetical protein, partial [Pseudomonas gessardii]|uniref:hypothetical protein n=1 Tax=Pseudomonas gessardii TaxID=78544 RepID=UPI001FF85652
TEAKEYGGQGRGVICNDLRMGHGTSLKIAVTLSDGHDKQMTSGCDCRNFVHFLNDNSIKLPNPTLPSYNTALFRA